VASFVVLKINNKYAEMIETSKINKLNRYHNVPPDQFIPFARHIRGAPGALIVKYLHRLIESLVDNNPIIANADDDVNNCILTLPLSSQDTQDKYTSNLS